MLRVNPPNEEEISVFIRLFPYTINICLRDDEKNIDLLEWISTKNLEKVKQTIADILIKIFHAMQWEDAEEKKRFIENHYFFLYTTLFMFAFENKIQVPVDAFAWMEKIEMKNIKQLLLFYLANRLS